eukprot:6004078-Amphidinium_carterae.2
MASPFHKNSTEVRNAKVPVARSAKESEMMTMRFLTLWRLKAVQGDCTWDPQATKACDIAGSATAKATTGIDAERRETESSNAARALGP